MRRLPAKPVDISAVWSLGSDCPETIDFSALFGNDHPTELEIGSGKGLFLLRQSQTQPAVNFLGVEWSKKYSQMAAIRLVKHGVGNVRIFAMDARLLLPRLPTSALRAVHIYFPDPWWKKRHQKRRIVCKEVIDEVARMLQPQGNLWLVTDVQEYYGVMQQVVGACSLLAPVLPLEPSEPEHDLDYLTHFERKYRQVGKPIYRLGYRRTDSR